MTRPRRGARSDNQGAPALKDHASPIGQGAETSAARSEPAVGLLDAVSRSPEVHGGLVDRDAENPTAQSDSATETSAALPLGGLLAAVSCGPEVHGGLVDMDVETPTARSEPATASTPRRPPSGGLLGVFALGPKDYAGLLAEFLWGFGPPMMCADCGDGRYEWLPLDEVAGSDDESVGHKALFPELGSLLCTGREAGVLVVAGCKERRVDADARPRGQLALFKQQVKFLEQFKDLWARSRRLRLRQTESAEREEAAVLAKEEAAALAVDVL